MTNNKRRALVLVDESARHPFLRSLPPHVRGAAISTGAPRAGAQAGIRRFTRGDLRDFLLAYCACLVAAVTFLY